MRQLHQDIRRYDTPIKLIKFFKNKSDLGIDFEVEETSMLIYANIFNEKNRQISGAEGSEVSRVVCLIPNPPFEIEMLNHKVLVGNRLYSIDDVDYYPWTRGQIKLLLVYERAYDWNFDKENKLESK